MRNSHTILASISLYLLLADRLYLRTSTGGRGVIPLLELWILLVAILLVKLDTRALIFMRNTAFRVYWFPFLLLSILLPVCGVLFADFPVRALSGGLQGMRALALLILGGWISTGGKEVWRLGTKYLVFVVLAETVFAAAQFGQQNGLVSGFLFHAQRQWDLYTQYQFKESYVLAGRSIGTLINPNELGFWSVLAFWCCALVLRGLARPITAIASLVMVAFSQSRGALMALIVSLLFWLGYLALSRNREMREARHVWFAVLLIALLAGMWTSVLFAKPLGKLPVAQRFATGLEVVSRGSTADPNVEGRVNSWARALNFYSHHPFGTGGEPQFRYGSFLDNDYVRVLLQGSPLYLLTFLLILYGGLRAVNRGLSGRVVAMLSMVLAVDAITATPMGYPPIAMLWVAVGCHLGLTTNSAPARSLGTQAIENRMPAFT